MLVPLDVRIVTRPLISFLIKGYSVRVNKIPSYGKHAVNDNDLHTTIVSDSTSDTNTQGGASGKCT